jgi:hypothetical protein
MSLRFSGPSKRVRLRLGLRIRFNAQFEHKPDRNPILHLAPIAMVCLISHLWQQIVHRIVRQFVRKIAPVDGILAGSGSAR